jgi:4-carboxymuconolactone decarboxylase
MPPTPQGFGADRGERLPLIAETEMTPEQRAAAAAIINGPRKAVFGPFVPLLHRPALMERVGEVGAALRFQGILADPVRELVIAWVARATDNQFEWQMHAPLAVKAGIAPAVLDAVAQGRHPQGLAADLAVALDVAAEIIGHNGLSDATYAEAVSVFGPDGLVEMTALVGYFAMICWVMNVARTPGPGSYPALAPLPS